LYGVASYSDSSPTSSKDFNHQVNSHIDNLLSTDKVSSLNNKQIGNNNNTHDDISHNNNNNNSSSNGINGSNHSNGDSVMNGVKVITSIESFYHAYDCLSMKSDDGLQKGELLS